ncbi:MAG: NCS1 family nucleobase:cation symporter-1 [Bdellovibrionales bacterium]|nr:NCS1 family nucleobase:cation symporter-1 [Bdellovibrionales bacterium]
MSTSYGKYSNEDLDPVPVSNRTWKASNYVALWVSMSLCIPTYMLASSLIEGGMNWFQAVMTVFLGNLIVLVPMILNGHVGAAYGIPFPVFARSSFGIRGANIPAILRAIVACGWFGIQTWIGGYALFQIVKVWVPGIAELPHVFPDWMGLETGPALTFFLFWCLNLYVIYLGIESIRKLLVFKAIFLPVAALSLLAWAIAAAKGLGPILDQPSKLEGSAFWAFFFPGLTGMVGFWATVSLNIPDFTRYAVSQRAHQLGQALGLPPSMALFAFIGVVVTSATSIVFGKTIWDPVVLAGMFDSPILVSLAMLAVVISTLATNIAANIVSPANDFANLVPDKIDFRKGGYITGLLGLLICPWKLIADPTGYIFKWLIAYSSLLGPIGGILIVDYYWYRRKQLVVDDLYKPNTQYWYNNGFNYKAVIALVIGVLPCVPGFLTTIDAVAPDTFPAFLNSLYLYAWFVSLAVGGGAYALLMSGSRK